MKHTVKLITYTITLAILTILLFQSCGDKSTGGGEDVTAPTVVSSIPLDNEVDVAVTSGIIISFSEKIDSASINSTNIIITGNPAVSFNVIESALFIHPQSNLSYEQTYTVSISDISDLHNNPMTTAYSFSFTTEVDPATIPPEVISVTPTHNATDVPPNGGITVRFSKGMERTTINSSTFLLNNGDITGTYVYDPQARRSYFILDQPLPYDSIITATITTAVQDTFGVSLLQDYSWSFSTQSLIPQASIFSPDDSVIIDDSTNFYFLTNHPIGTESLLVYIDDVYHSTIIGNSTSYEFNWLINNYEIGSIHSIYGVAFDASGKSGTSETQTVHYLWEQILTDGNEGFNQLEVPNDLRKLFARSTDTTLELRIEYAYNWEHPYFDTAVDLGIFLDSDQNINTGRRDAAGDTINDIGADYRIILGLHGGDTTLAVSNAGVWSKIYDTTGLVYHNIPQDTNIMEIGFLWNDIGDNNAVDLVLLNVFFRDSNNPSDFLIDYAPEQDNGHVTIFKERKYVGQLPQPTPSQPTRYNQKATSASYPENPFR